MLKNLKKFCKIKITPQDILTNKKYDFVLTSDFYRADLGYIIVRLPIFLEIQDQDIKNSKFDYKFQKKNNLEIPLYQELLDFKKKSYLESGKEFDDKPTHFIKNKNNKKIFYRANSKNFKFTDPLIRDHKSIQHQGLHPVYYLVKQNGKWKFPSVPLTNRETANNYKENFVKKNIPKANLAFLSDYPIGVRRENIEREEIEDDEIFEKFKGKKIFFFEALHDYGKMDFEGVEDWAWVTKFEMNKYVEREYFDFFNYLHHK